MSVYSISIGAASYIKAKDIIISLYTAYVESVVSQLKFAINQANCLIDHILYNAFSI